MNLPPSASFAPTFRSIQRRLGPLKAVGFTVSALGTMMLCGVVSTPSAELPSAAPSPQVSAAVAHLPVRFEPNVGQFDSRASFVARGGGTTLFLTETGATMTVPHGHHGQASGAAPSRLDWRVRLANEPSGPIERVTAGELLPTKHNYFVGRDPARWRTDVPTYSSVRQQAVARGVDVVWHGEGGRLEYDIIVSPGTNAADVIVEIGGDGEALVQDDGAIEIRVGDRVVRHEAPTVYQETETGRVERKASYRVIDEHRLAFEVASYDRSSELVIDPLVYSTYLGGNEPGIDNESLNGVAVDGSGAVYVTGYSDAANFPTVTPFQGTRNGTEDAVVAKLAPDGGSLVYATYLGGSDFDAANAIAVDGTGAAYVAGGTSSTDFPTAGPFQNTSGGLRDVFVVKLSAAGNALSYATYFGGTNTDDAHGIAVSSGGEAVVVGATGGGTFPTSQANQAVFGGSASDGFVARFNAAGSALVYSTYLGGNGPDELDGVALDSNGAAYVTGFTTSSDLPTLNALQSAAGGQFDGVAAKLTAAGARVYTTYLGTAGDDRGLGVAVDSSGAAYFGGQTTSSSFVRLGAFPAPGAGASQYGYLTKLAPAGTLAYSLLLGNQAGSQTNVQSVAVDATGSAHVSGASTSIVTKNAVQPNPGGAADLFVAQIDAPGAGLVHATYLGGGGLEQRAAIALDGTANEYIVGTSESSNFPTKSPFQATRKGNTDGVIVKLSPVTTGSDAGAEAGPDAGPAEGGLPDAAPPFEAGDDGSTPAATSDRVEGGGCGCRAAPSAPVGPGHLVAFAVGLLAIWGRRLRRRQS